MAATNLQLTTIDLGDPADPWRAAGFLVHDGPRGAEVRLGSTVLRLTGRGGRVLAWALEGASGDLDGLASTTAATVGGASPEHPNGISRIDHVVVSSGDVERTVENSGGVGEERPRAGDAVDALSVSRSASRSCDAPSTAVASPSSKA